MFVFLRLDFKVVILYINFILLFGLHVLRYLRKEHVFLC